MSHSETAEVHLAHHFEDVEQQKDAATLGMWLFLATEILFFGGLFLAYSVYKYRFFPAFIEGSRELDVMLGATNTVILLTSSLTMALAVRNAQLGARRGLIVCLALTLLLGLAFMGVKAVEWHAKWEHHLIPGPNFADIGPHSRHAQLFFMLYFVMTGLHAVHVLVGLAVMAVLIIFAARKTFSREYYTPVELSGLYWHFVDIIWIYLFPLLYLLGFHHR